MEMPPHLFSIADNAYQFMVQGTVLYPHHTECKNGAKMHFIFFKTCDNKNNATALRNVRFIVTEFLSIVCFFNRIPFHCFQIVKTSLCLSRKYAI